MYLIDANILLERLYKKQMERMLRFP